MKTKKKSAGVLGTLMMEKKEDQDRYSTDKGHWKVLDGEWVWIPVDKRGVPLTEKGKPGIPEE